MAGTTKDTISRDVRAERLELPGPAHSFATPVVPNTTRGWPWGLRYNSGLVATAVAATSEKNGVCGTSDSPSRVREYIRIGPPEIYW